MLKHAERLGADTDSPEGVRYIQISDTLAMQWANRLYRIWVGLTAEANKEVVG